MRYRALVARAIKRVHMNTVSGPARTCAWNGRPLDIIESAAPSFVEDSDDGRPGVLMKTKDIVVSFLDMPKPPKATENVNFDGEIWTVINVDKQLVTETYVISIARRSS